MMLTLVDPPKFSPPPKSDVDRLRARLDDFVSTLDDAFPPDMIGRALLAKGADVVMKSDGHFASRWAISRTLDLMTGFWVPENIRSFVTKGNAMQKNGRNANVGADGFSTPGPCGFAKAGGKNVSLSTDSWKPRQRPIYGSTPKERLAKGHAGSPKTHIVGHRGD